MPRVAARSKGRGNIERERKFLVEDIPAGALRRPHELLEQGYLQTSGPSGAEVRIRRTKNRYVLTLKEGRGTSRVEREVHLPSSVAEVLWPLTKGRRLAKTRYRIPHAGLTIELDVYRGALRGLVVAEVEFRSDSALRRFVPPPWFGKEVT